jgi:outer membrane protein
MKDTILYTLNGLLAVAVAVLFYFQFSKPKNVVKPAPAANNVEVKESGLIAYVDLDSLEENYILFKEKKAELEKRQKSIETTLTQKAAAFQKELYALQERAPMMTQSEGEEAQKRMYQKQMELEEMRDRMAKQFVDEQDAFNKELQARLDSFLSIYNADKRYSFIFSHIKGGPLLYHDESYNITNDVIKGMNEALPKADKK